MQTPPRKDSPASLPGRDEMQGLPTSHQPLQAGRVAEGVLESSSQVLSGCYCRKGDFSKESGSVPVSGIEAARRRILHSLLLGEWASFWCVLAAVLFQEIVDVVAKDREISTSCPCNPLSSPLGFPWELLIHRPQGIKMPLIISQTSRAGLSGDWVGVEGSRPKWGLLHPLGSNLSVPTIQLLSREG